MTPFEEACKFTASQEGGYVNDPLDRGGATNYGVTQDTYNGFRKRRGLPLQPVSSIMPEEVKAVMLEFWRGGRCDSLPPRIAVAHFDACFHHGPGNAARLLQRAVGAADDGAIGPKTRAAVARVIAATGDGAVLAGMLRERELFCRAIVKTDARQTRFIGGWLNRVSALERHFGVQRMTADTALPARA